jgi:hypothetical protein
MFVYFIDEALEIAELVHGLEYDQLAHLFERIANLLV